MANEKSRLQMLREQRFQQINAGLQNGTLRKSTVKTDLSVVQSGHIAHLTEKTKELKKVISDAYVSSQQWPFGSA